MGIAGFNLTLVDVSNTSETFTKILKFLGRVILIPVQLSIYIYSLCPLPLHPLNAPTPNILECTLLPRGWGGRKNRGASFLIWGHRWLAMRLENPEEIRADTSSPPISPFSGKNLRKKHNDLTFVKAKVSLGLSFSKDAHLVISEI